MKLTIQSIHFNAADHLKAYVQRKADKLDTYFDRITDGEVSLKLQNEIKGANKLVEVPIKVVIPPSMVPQASGNNSLESDTLLRADKTEAVGISSDVAAKLFIKAEKIAPINIMPTIARTSSERLDLCSMWANV